MSIDLLPLPVTGLDLSKFVSFTPLVGRQNARWRVEGEPKANAKGYARFNNRVGRMLGTLALNHSGSCVHILEFDDGEVEAFSPIKLFPEREQA